MINFLGTFDILHNVPIDPKDSLDFFDKGRGNSVRGFPSAYIATVG
jgi:hypothetical protein